MNSHTTSGASRQPHVTDLLLCINRYGACAGYDPTLWEVDDSNAAPLLARRAKGICRDCPVLSECLAYSLEVEEYGIWAGLDAREREELRRAKVTRMSERNKWARVARMRSQGYTREQIAQEFGVSRRTVFRWLNRIDEQAA
jgi:WhiB family redox-sensing transcriptional regulator